MFISYISSLSAKNMTEPSCCFWECNINSKTALTFDHITIDQLLGVMQSVRVMKVHQYLQDEGDGLILCGCHQVTGM